MEFDSRYYIYCKNGIDPELRKNDFNTSQNEGMYYFRDSAGNEVDLIIERDGEPTAIEIKSGRKVDNNMLRGLKYWQKLRPDNQGILVHGGTSNKIINERMSLLPWTEVLNL